MTQKSVLITVGTTCFERLIRITDTVDFIELLHASGYKNIVYQIGKGTYQPKNGQFFRLSSNINEYYAKADLLITHGGAGTLLQNLPTGKLIIAVTNDQLLGNHQLEIVQKLATEGYILGFDSSKQLQSHLNKVKQFLKNGATKIYKRPQRCILNQLVFKQ